MPSALLLIHDAVSFMITMVRRKLRNQENQDCRKPDVMLRVTYHIWFPTILIFLVPEFPSSTILEQRGGEGFIFHDGAYQETEAIIIILLLMTAVLGVLVAFTTQF